MDSLQPDFDKLQGLLPAVVQDANSRVVLMVGFMNAEAFIKTRETGLVTFFSRSRQSLWTKGETSGNFLKVVDLALDCDQDTLLVKAIPVGPVCHTGADTCFNESNQPAYGFLSHLEAVIHQRRGEQPETSYTASLFAKGINKIAQKVGEEAVEVVIEAKDNDREKFVNECADLLFHYMVLLEAKGESLHEIVSVLESRHKPRP